MKLTAIILAATLAASPAMSGGPVIEDTTETVAPRKERKIGGILIAIAAVAIIAAIAGGDEACTVEDPVTPPEPGC